MEEYAQGYEKRYGKDGFMMLIPAPQDLKTGEPAQSAVATVNIERLDWSSVKEHSHESERKGVSRSALKK